VIHTILQVRWSVAMLVQLQLFFSVFVYEQSKSTRYASGVCMYPLLGLGSQLFYQYSVHVQAAKHLSHRVKLLMLAGRLTLVLFWHYGISALMTAFLSALVASVLCSG
jgi:hypothetical protein